MKNTNSVAWWLSGIFPTRHELTQTRWGVTYLLKCKLEKKKKDDWLLPRKTTNVLRARNNYLCCSARSMPVVRELRQIAVLMHSVPWRWRGLIIVCSTGHLGVAKCLIRGGLCVRMPMAGARLRHLLLSHVFWQLPEGTFQSSYDLNSLHSIWISRFWIVVNQ